MHQSEFSQLCKQANPVKVEAETYGDIKITFDNGVYVEVGKTTDYDCSVFTFDSSVDIEKREREWKEREAKEKETKRLFEEHRSLIRQKYTDEQWAELEQAFLYNNGMTFEQNKELRKQHDEILGSIIQKYGYDKDGKSNFNDVLEFLK